MTLTVHLSPEDRALLRRLVEHSHQLKEIVMSLKEDIAALRTEVADLKTDFEGYKTGVDAALTKAGATDDPVVVAAVAAIRADVATLDGEVKAAGQPTPPAPPADTAAVADAPAAPAA